MQNGNATYSSVNGVLFNYNKTELIRYPEGKKEKTYIIPDTVTQIAQLGFWRNQALEKVEIPNTVTKIGGNAFQFGSSLESVIIPIGVTSVEDFMFDGCTSLTEVIIHNSVTKIGNSAFYNCVSLTSLDIPDSVIYIGRNAFYNSILDNKIYYVTKSLSNINSSNIKNFIIIDEDSYETRLIANEGYKLPQDIKVRVNEYDLSLNDYEYDKVTGSLKISADEIKGNIEIEAVGVKMIKVSFDANEGEFSDGTKIIKYDDAEDCDLSNLDIPTRDGYKFIGYYTEETGGTSIDYIMNSEAGIEEDIIFYAQWEKIYSYTFIIGESQTFTLNQIDEYSFKIDGDYKLLNKLIISNLNLVKDVDFKVTEGSTIITFTETGLAKLNTLAVGTYDVVVGYSYDKEVKGTLIIEADTTKEDNTNTNTNKQTGNNPQTSDNIMLFIVVLGISIIGITITTIIKKN